MPIKERQPFVIGKLKIEIVESVETLSKINLLQCENQLLQQENIELQGKVKLLRVKND